MNQIINGKIYNTETAELIHDEIINNNREGIYRKGNGELFIVTPIGITPQGDQAFLSLLARYKGFSSEFLAKFEE